MMMELFNLLPIICWLLHTLCMSLAGGQTCGALKGGNDGNRYRIDLQPSDFLRQNTNFSVRWYMEPVVPIKTNDYFSISDDKTTLYVLVLNASTYGTYFVDCFLTIGPVYRGSNRHHVNNTVLVSTTFETTRSTQTSSTQSTRQINDNNECASIPCKNGATCIDGVAGWNGINCDQNINECSPNPCQNGATCNDIISGYSCKCVAGWTGTNCDQNINECATIPCKNGATCNDGINAYSCMCVAGWTGTNCDQNINECVINPCKNGAACVDGINAYTCNCVAKWGGINCDQNINECSPNPCQNGATCIDGINAYTCNCVAGWSGKNCDQNKRTDTTSTTKSQPISNDAHTDRIDTSVLTPRASIDGFQNVIIAVACVVSAVIIAIAVVIAVVCVKRKRRSMANVPLPDAPREDQVAEEKGYASIGDSECQYAVVNKPKKQSTLQVKQDPPVENKPMEMQSNPEKPSGAGELIYADLDKEALKAKPSNSKPAGTLERPSTPTEYVGIDFARTVALQDANKLEE